MPDYGRYCPISLGSEVLADRWTPLIVRELLLGNTRFNDIARGLPGISRSLLVQRLRHLERKGVIERWPAAGGRGHEYRLTPAGRELEAVVNALGRWSVEWLFDELDPNDISAVNLLWWMHRRMDAERLPPGRVVVEFRFTEPERETYWLVLDRGDASLCIQHPGFEPDVVVTTTTRALAEVFAGYSAWAGAQSTGAITVTGPPALVRSVPRWFLGSPFADVVSLRAKRAKKAQRDRRAAATPA